jgi:hypothetical protein
VTPARAQRQKVFASFFKKKFFLFFFEKKNQKTFACLEARRQACATRRVHRALAVLGPWR